MFFLKYLVRQPSRQNKRAGVYRYLHSLRSCMAQVQRVVTTINSGSEHMRSPVVGLKLRLVAVPTPLLQRRASSSLQRLVARGWSVWQRRKNRMVCAGVVHPGRTLISMVVLRTGHLSCSTERGWKCLAFLRLMMLTLRSRSYGCIGATAKLKD